MNIGELWVAHPLFPWLMIILTAWVGFSTATMVRNWIRILQLERHNKLLQEMVVQGVGNIARQIRDMQPEFIERGEEQESGIQGEEPATATIEEADEDWDSSPPPIIAKTDH